MTISEFTIARYNEVFALWQRTPGICIRDADSREAIARYLTRNPGLSFIAEENGQIIGSALSGHDGRRGYLQHVVVETSFRGRGIAHELVTRCLDALASADIAKVHLEVLNCNDLANRYWTRRGWRRRDDTHRYSYTRPGHENA
jgi:N-acetylglutamate synthase